MSKGNYSPHESSIAHMDANIMAALTYILPILATYLPLVWRIACLIPIFIFFIEKESNLVKFHAMQSALFYVVRIILLTFLHFIPFLGGILSLVASIILILIACIAIIGAFNYEETHLPLIGNFVAKLIK